MFKMATDTLDPQPVITSWLQSSGVDLSVLRIDQLHPVVSGNKWYKLKYYLLDAIENEQHTILTFGGCFSNHLLATAYAVQQAGLHAVGVVRGEKESINSSSTLQKAVLYGMKLRFVSRGDYRIEKRNINGGKNVYCIPEGGYGKLGAKGAGEMLTAVKNYQQYSHIILAVGTGTTMAGLLEVASPLQKIIGISIFKNNYSLQMEMENLLSPEAMSKKYELVHNYHWGGYARKTQELLDFMNIFYRETGIPTDFVYTAKAMFAIKQMILNNNFPRGSRLLFVHTGGLMGNLSLNPGQLIFQ